MLTCCFVRTAVTSIWHSHAQTSQWKMNILEVIQFMQALNPAERLFLSEEFKVVKLVLPAPATTAINERSFSALKSLNTYICILPWEMIV